MKKRLLIVPVLFLFLVACEDNIGRIWDTGNPSGGGTGTGTGIQAVETGGLVIDGRPKVVDAFPKGGGWPTTVPIVVVFTESVNESIVSPSQQQGGTPTLYLRLAGTEAQLPAVYDFLLGGTVVVIRPADVLSAAEGTSYEVVVDPELKDIDGVRFGGDEVEVVATFTADEAEGVDDAVIVTTLPLDNANNRIRETPFYALFSKPATSTSLTNSNFQLRTAGGTVVSGTQSFPLSAGPSTSDGRILRFEPASSLAEDTEYQLFVDATIAFGQGFLEFKGRTPFARFSTHSAEQASSIAVGNATAGFPDQINRNNLLNLQIDVALPASTQAGDTAVVRIYGQDPKAVTTDNLEFVERSASAAAAGAGTVTVDFTGQLGSLTEAKFLDGDVVFAVQVRRGSRRSGFIRGSTTNSPRLDITLPTLSVIGPPTGSTASDILTDQESLVFYGTASEKIATASLSAGASTAVLYASDDSGAFVLLPIALGRRSTVLPYTLSLTDAAGNVVATSLSGNIVQRGLVTGALSGAMTVEAFDSTTFAPLSGVTVVLDPGMPTKPAAAGRVTGSTGTNGLVSFSSLASGSYSVTLIKDGYHLTTLLDTPSAYVSMPMRPLTNATATFSGAAILSSPATLVPVPGQTALIGCNLIDDVTEEEITTLTTSPLTIPSTQIRPNRPVVVTGFLGIFEPTAVTTFTGHACGMCGPTGLVETPPVAPIAPGESGTVALVLNPAAGTSDDLAATYTVDFSVSGGLGTISGTPTTRIVASINGFPGQTLFGVGFVSMSGSTATVDGSYSLASYLSLSGFSPTLWVSTEARDADGNIARHRRLISNPNTGLTLATTAAPGIPAITTPSGASTGSPSVTYADRLDKAAVIGGFASTELTATDGNGRLWTLLQHETSVSGGTTTVQFPDMSGLSPTGLATGSWSVRAENYLMLTLTSAGSGDWVLDERKRQLVTYARAKPVTFTVQ